MNESDTRLHKIDLQLRAAGWGVGDESNVTTEYREEGRLCAHLPQREARYRGGLKRQGRIQGRQRRLRHGISSWGHRILRLKLRITK